MVVFTCNHCGDSLQKPRVEKHYATQCRNVKFLTCVDCHKDFRKEEYVAHTKCITEEQRYAAKGSVSAENLVKKGDVKQESWMEMIKSIVETQTDISPGIRNLLNRISEYTNVPRKKQKFANFLKNSTGGRVSPDDIETAWALIETHCKNNPQNTKSEESKKSEKGEKRKPEENGQESPKKKKSKKSEGADNTDVLENGAANESKKSKKKRKLENGDEDGAVVEPAASNGVGQRRTLKKFEGLAELEDGSGNHQQDAQNEDNSETNTSSKKTKKDKKKSKDIDTGNAQQIEPDHQEADADLAKIEKKKNKKLKQSLDKETSFEVENVANGTNSEMPKRKKKRDSKCLTELTDASESQPGSEDLLQNSQDNDDSSKSKKSKASKSTESPSDLDASTVSTKKFDFGSKIIEILAAKKEMSCKKLQKKVLGAYLAETGESECTEKVMKKYNKQLRKLDNVDVSDDVVKIV